MTKADIVNEISKNTGIEKAVVLENVEKFMESVKGSLANGENVYLRGFGSFIVKKRAQKTARNISKNTTIIIPAHNIPAFKPAKTFMGEVKKENQYVSSIDDLNNEDNVSIYLKDGYVKATIYKE